ncbi:TetR/AcrR family transcriptional regulator [Corynebacterium aurimucosum]|uniref:TetR/AcrR family transcriptional regulator n=1 Tax=Corynebacterium aurimucosum TaxID=169292 RepID=A0A558IZE7_9CORY|nr:TetR/AcrR family transcriptional regulator [Corynebacterium aurimucosum]TVU86736.1 TetR/AcrR family transcriptional regulator [Corynebacterium aurimucosum]
MPKITETTVAEHRAVQHRAVLEAAERLIVNNHGAVPTLAEVAAEVGLARPSVYRYVSSQHDLLVQLLIHATQTWNEQLEAAMQVAPPEPTQRIHAYVDATLELFLHGTHGPLMTAAQHFPQAFADEAVQQSHGGFASIVNEFCPGVSKADISLLNAAIVRASELADRSPEQLPGITQTLYAMADAIVPQPSDSQ